MPINHTKLDARDVHKATELSILVVQSLWMQHLQGMVVSSQQADSAHLHTLVLCLRASPFACSGMPRMTEICQVLGALPDVWRTYAAAGVAPPPPLLGALRPIPLRVGVIIDWFSNPPQDLFQPSFCLR